MKSFLQEVSRGLSKKNKKLSSKWFYDFHGSKLFEQITKLKEYYPTRTEIKILKDNKIEIANKIGKKAVLIEPGAGDIKKIGIFLEINSIAIFELKTIVKIEETKKIFVLYRESEKKTSKKLFFSYFSDSHNGKV